MRLLTSIFIFAATEMMAAEPTDLAAFIGKHPEIRKVEPGVASTMRHDVPFADAVYECPVQEPGFRKWIIASEGKIIAHYIELVTTLTQEQANQVVDDHFKSIGLQMISCGGGFPSKEAPAGSSKLFFLYGNGDLFSAAQKRFDDKIRQREQAEADRLLRFLKAAPTPSGGDKPSD